jgi:hypothetical protein
MQVIVVLTTVVLLLTGPVLGLPTGQPNDPESCETMTPRHPGTEPQRYPPPFVIEINQDSYTERDPVNVTLKMKDNEKFRGFAIQARRIDERYDRIEPVGFFQNFRGTKLVCNLPKSSGAMVHGNGLTHTNDSFGSQTPKSSISFLWNPGRSHGHIQFRVTVAINFHRYWVAEPSRVIRDALLKDPAPVDTTPMPRFVTGAISTAGCGRTKGCYRNPPGCSVDSCDILATWHVDIDHVRFELVADTEGWVAIGLSEDLKMGNDYVYECVANASSTDPKRPVIGYSRNLEKGKVNQVISTTQDLKSSDRFSSSDGIIDNGRISCSFNLMKSSSHSSLSTHPYHLLLAKGLATHEGKKKMHVLEANKYPYVSINKVALSQRDDITNTARYILVKVHGCLMLIGWMMCSSTALILAKYYKPMWPNDRICGERVWFAVHRGCMAINLFATVIGFIIIFIHADGYSQMPNLPDKAHPILGIITTILCVMNPLIALCRCHDKSDKRPIFNWIHWFIGTCATVLAIPTLMIGLNLPKAHVPWWATWVMVAFLLFHLIIELMLEIHGCLNSKKQKYRTQEYEMRNVKGSEEQEPVGKRFKKIILTIYLIVVICLGIVMVISVAAG